LSTLNSALQRCVDSKVMISQSFKNHVMFILQIMHLFSIETLENLTSSRVTILVVTCWRSRSQPLTHPSKILLTSSRRR
jgi:hypothetical protein